MMPPGSTDSSAMRTDFNPLDKDSRCKTSGGQTQSLLVEWSAADRGALESAAKQGTVVVRYADCELQLLARCKAPGSYRYTALSPKQEQIAIKDEDALYANIPVGAASLSGKLREGEQLDVNLKIVGQFGIDKDHLANRSVSGDCAEATHFVTALSIGAFELNTIRSSEAGGGASAFGAGVGADRSRRSESLRRDGDMSECGSSTARPSEAGPPPGCSAVLRVTLAPLADEPASDEQPLPLTRFRSVAVGARHVCAIRYDGKVLCFGDNSQGQAPPEPTAESFKSIAAGGSHTCGIRDDDKVVCWGSNEMGQTPKTVPIDTSVALSSGSNGTCAINMDDKILCWGGGPSDPIAESPSVARYKSVSNSAGRACGVRSDDMVVCFGRNPSDGARTLKKLGTVTMVAAGSKHTCAIRLEDNKVVCEGTNSHGQAPVGPSADSYKYISASDRCTCGIRNDDKVVCWGDCDPTLKTPSKDSFVSISVGPSTICGVRTDATLACSGEHTVESAASWQ